MNWHSYISSFTSYLFIEKGLSKNTIDSYRRDVEKLTLFLKENTIDCTPINISSENIQQFIYEVSKTIKARSQARIISGLKAFFEYLMIEGYRDNNPIEIIESPKIGLKLPDSLSEPEINEIVEAIDLNHPQGPRNKTIIETLYGCGVRVSELINLKISDLYFNEGFIKVTGKGNKQRLIPITDYTEQIITNFIKEYRQFENPQKDQEDYLFLNRRGKQLTRVMIFTIIKNLCKIANITKKVSPHTFRHSFASHLLAGGADLNIIQQLLGHESITTTEIYLHVDKSHLKKVLEEFHPLGKNIPNS